MAFNLDVSLEGYEYRGVESGVSKKTGKPWMSLILEQAGERPRQLSVSVPEELQASVSNLGLKRGDVLNFPVSAVASQKYNFVTLRGLPTALAGVDY